MEIEIWDEVNVPRMKKGYNQKITIYKSGKFHLNAKIAEQLGLKEGDKISFFRPNKGENGSRKKVYLEPRSENGIVLSAKKSKTTQGELTCNHKQKDFHQKWRWKAKSTRKQTSN